MPAERGAHLQVTVDVAHASLALTGELDLGTVCAVHGAAPAMLVASAATITIDLRGLQFIDAAGLGGLVQLCARLSAAGRRVILVRSSAKIRRTFEVAGLADLL